ncbi:hypothetical protein Q4503_12035 [Colwellia sp. 6_MG-2023]|uniref:hypothetical protein n=1 Tax=Colwellia sp. 6_MG-2023 TaxID=3062676 RepID=UPI0026E3E01D|nr:hypothetical protein [Colwellia sp. 6_MG-2023]MDO6488436.1 hypothetical protein [Colwellia sp. 6_MG-2023]
MISVEELKINLKRPYHPDSLHIAVDANDDSQLYIISNGGMANINCAPIESYTEEIKNCVREMISQDELFIKENEKSLRIGYERSVYSYSVKSNIDDSKANLDSQKLYFSSTFIRWQRSHQLSDEVARVKLGLTAEEFHQFREDELTISEDLMAILAEVTGSSLLLWQNLKSKKIKRSKGNNENI